ncbi:MAG: hypothetical protein ACEQR8_02610 [Cypionkella sp.]
MRADFDLVPTIRARRRRDTYERLREALLSLAGGRATIVRHTAKAWASVTFEGARHTLELEFTGAAAVAAGERLIAELPEHEFAIPGELVADASVIAADHTLLSAPRLAVTCELLVLRDA